MPAQEAAAENKPSMEAEKAETVSKRQQQLQRMCRRRAGGGLDGAGPRGIG